MYVMVHLHFSEVPVYLFVAPLFSNLTGIIKPVGHMIAAWERSTAYEVIRKVFQDPHSSCKVKFPLVTTAYPRWL